MSPVGAQVWVAVSYHFVNDSSEKEACYSTVNTEYACCYPVLQITSPLYSWDSHHPK